MKKNIAFTIFVASSLLVTPAYADSDISAQSSAVREIAKTNPHSFTLSPNQFDLSSVESAKPFSVVPVRLASEQEYRLISSNNQDFNEAAFTTAGLTNALSAFGINEAQAFASLEQDTGVDALVPGRFISSSVRSDYIVDGTPGANDKSALGVKFGF